MKRILIAPLLFVLLISIISSCSTDNKEEPEIPEIENEKLPSILEKVDNDLGSAVLDGEITTTQQAIEYAKRYSEYSGSETPQEGYVTLHFGDYEYFIDFTGTSVLQFDTNHEDETDVEDICRDYEKNLGITFPNSSSQTKAESRATDSSTGGNSLLTRRNILVWNMLAQEKEFASLSISIPSYFKELKDKGRVFTYDIQEYAPSKNHTSAYMLSRLQKMAEYDVVYIACHGNPDGTLCIPRDGSFNSSSCPVGIICNQYGRSKYLKLKKAWFDRYVKTSNSKFNLSSTIVWASVCYAFNEGGALYDFCKENSVADFYGADNIWFANTSFDKFKKFYTKFINGTPSHRAYSILRMDEEYIGDTKEHGRITGHFKMISPYHSLSYSYPLIRKVGREARATYIFYKGLLGSIYGNKSRVATQNISVGFIATDKNTGKQFLLPVSADNVNTDNYYVTEYEGVSAISLSLSNEALPQGTYLCKSYIDYGNGEPEYSDNEIEIEISHEYYTKERYDFSYKRRWLYTETVLAIENEWVTPFVYKSYSKEDDWDDHIYLYCNNGRYFIEMPTFSFGRWSYINVFEVGEKFETKVPNYSDEVMFDVYINSTVTDDIITAAIKINLDANGMFYKRVHFDSELTIDLEKQTMRYTRKYDQITTGTSFFANIGEYSKYGTAEMKYEYEPIDMTCTSAYKGKSDKPTDFSKYPGDGSGDWQYFYVHPQ